MKKITEYYDIFFAHFSYPISKGNMKREKMLEIFLQTVFPTRGTKQLSPKVPREHTYFLQVWEE